MAEDKTIEMIWVDIETTGLMEGVDKILEIGIVLTDRWGDWIAGDSWLVGDGTYADAVIRGKKHEIVGPMHDKSLLWRDWAEGRSKWGEHMHHANREQNILDFLKGWGIEPGKIPMAGATVHFDRKMIAAQMPELEAFFHYRNFDISTVKQAARWFNPTCAEADPSYADDLQLHRGLDDCLWEIHEYQHYIQNFFFVVD